MRRIRINEGERENNSFWYIKEMIEREINKAYRLRDRVGEIARGCPYRVGCLDL